jgi:hypothetical protein
LIAETALTAQATNIFQSVNVDLTATALEQLAEFSSRITYLAFLDHTPPPHSSRAYLSKMIHEYQHRSIVSSIRLSYLLLLDESTMSLENYETLLQSVWKVGGTMTVCARATMEEREGHRAVVLTVNLKSLHTLFKEWGQTLPQIAVLQSMVEQAHSRYSFAIDTCASYFSR